MNANKALWEKGDFTKIAASMRESGEAVVAGFSITPGLKVLDWTSDAATERRPCRRPNRAPTCSASISRAIFSIERIIVTGRCSDSWHDLAAHDKPP